MRGCVAVPVPVLTRPQTDEYRCAKLHEGDGKLSLSELRTAIDTITQDDSVPLPPTAQNDKAADRLELSVSKVFDEIDTDHSGEVDLEEFEAHTRKVLASVASLLEEAPIIIVRSSEYTTVSAEDGAPAPAEGAE